jgi:hypothetical protein
VRAIEQLAASAFRDGDVKAAREGSSILLPASRSEAA